MSECDESLDLLNTLDKVGHLDFLTFIDSRRDIHLVLLLSVL